MSVTKDAVGDVNSTWTPTCDLENVQYWGDITLMYGVDSDGEPMEEQDSTDMDFRCYVCLDCDNDFRTFNEVKEHIK
jgi:hypothetical protein